MRLNIMSLKTETDAKVPCHLFHINSMQKKIKSRRTESCTYKKTLPPFLLLCLPGPIHPCRRSNNKIYSQIEETDSHLTTCRNPPLLMIRPSGICINSAKVPVHLFPITSTQNNIKSRRTESLHTKRDSHHFCFCLPA